MLTEADLASRFQAWHPVRDHFVAQCPAHDDHRPSLKIDRGERAWLLRCWAGCTFREIVEAVGLTAEECFYDYAPKGTPRPRRSAPPPVRPTPWRTTAKKFLDEAMDEHLRADSIAAEVTGCDISHWTDEDLEQGWTIVDCGLVARARATTLERVAWNISAGGLRQEGKL